MTLFLGLRGWDLIWPLWAGGLPLFFLLGPLPHLVGRKQEQAAEDQHAADIHKLRYMYGESTDGETATADESESTLD